MKLCIDEVAFSTEPADFRDIGNHLPTFEPGKIKMSMHVISLYSEDEDGGLFQISLALPLFH